MNAIRNFISLLLSIIIVGISDSGTVTLWLLGSQLGSCYSRKKRVKVNSNWAAFHNVTQSFCVEIGIKKSTIIDNKTVEYLALMASAEKSISVYRGLHSEDGSFWLLECKLVIKRLFQDGKCQMLGTKVKDNATHLHEGLDKDVKNGWATMVLVVNAKYGDDLKCIDSEVDLLKMEMIITEKFGYVWSLTQVCPKLGKDSHSCIVCFIVGATLYATVCLLDISHTVDKLQYLWVQGQQTCKLKTGLENIRIIALFQLVILLLITGLGSHVSMCESRVNESEDITHVKISTQFKCVQGPVMRQIDNYICDYSHEFASQNSKLCAWLLLIV